MDVYHWTSSRRRKDSEMMREVKVTSPPGHTISEGEPVHAELGGLDLADALEAISEGLE